VAPTIKLEEFRGGILFNQSIEKLQTFDDPVDITDVLEESGRFLIKDVGSANAVTSETLVTLTIAGHDLVADNRFRIKDAVNGAFDGDFTVLTVNGDQVTYAVDQDPGPFLGSAQVIRLSITNPLDLRRDGLASGVAPPDSIFAWEEQLDEAVRSQIATSGARSWSDLVSTGVIGGGANVTFEGISDNAFRLEVDVMIDSELNLLLNGAAVMLDGVANIPVLLYADLGELGDGSAQFLTLMDVPERFGAEAVGDLDPLVGDMFAPLLTLRGLASFEPITGAGANAIAADGGFQIVLEGVVDVNIPGVTTLALEGDTLITVSKPGGGPDELLMDLVFDAVLSEQHAGALGVASGAFHVGIDTDVAVSASNPIGGIEIWGAARVDFELGFLESVGLFAPGERGTAGAVVCAAFRRRGGFPHRLQRQRRFLEQ
jgi:hypothetical protein